MTLQGRVAYTLGTLALVGYACLIALSVREGVPPFWGGSQSRSAAAGTAEGSRLLNLTRRHRQSSELLSPEAAFAARSRRVQAERSQQLADGCRWLRTQNGGRVRALRPEFARTFNIPSLRLTYCATPKCGTTSWFNFFERATGNACWRRGASIHTCARTKFDSPSSVAGFLSNSLVVVRDPWRRLVSAYEDKFVKERHVLAASCYRRHGKALHGAVPVTFGEFVSCILDELRAGRGLNAHYAPLHWQCSICKAKYGYMAKLETIADDFRYLATYVFPSRNYQEYNAIFSSVRRRPTELRNVTSIAYEDCYRSLAPDSLAALVRLYLPDAVLLGYAQAPLP